MESTYKWTNYNKTNKITIITNYKITKFNKISILQNKAVKIVGGGKCNDKATLFYANLNILKLSDLV